MKSGKPFSLKNILLPTSPNSFNKSSKPFCRRLKRHFNRKESVIIDYVILGKEYIQSFQKSFDKHLIFKVLLPEKEIIYQRDIERECWTSGRKTIDELYRKYEELVELIGKENYIDNGNEPAETTANKLLALLI